MIRSSSSIALNIMGLLKIVKEIARDQLDAGYHRFQWDGRSDLGAEVSSGIYFIRVSTPEMVKTVSDEQYQLDYISGATITSDGLNQFIGSHILGRYKSILSEVSE